MATKVMQISIFYDREFYKDATASVLVDDIHNDDGGGTV